MATDGERLHAGTLREVARRCREYAAKLFEHARWPFEAVAV